MQRKQARRLLVAGALAATLGACSSSAIIDKLPSDMGEPADAPARPAVAYQYPAVHDMPPPRPDQPLTDEQQVQMEQQLENLRDRQEGHSDKTAAKGSKKTKNQPAAAAEGETAGSKGNP